MISKCDQVFHYTGKEKEGSWKEATRRWTYITDSLEAQQLFHWQPGNNVKLTMNTCCKYFTLDYL